LSEEAAAQRVVSETCQHSNCQGDNSWPESRRDAGRKDSQGLPRTTLRAEEIGSNGKRGRIFGHFILMEGAYIQVSELVVIEDGQLHREEYAYYLVIGEEEIWGYERDLSHKPEVHRHSSPGHTRHASDPISFTGSNPAVPMKNAGTSAARGRRDGMCSAAFSASASACSR
jgi:hypothetical protein